MSARHQMQSQNFERKSLAQHLVGSKGNPTLQRSTPVPSLDSNMRTGSKLLGTIKRERLGTESLPSPRLEQASHFRKAQCAQTPETELSQSDRDDEEQSLSQETGFDVDKGVAGSNQHSHYHRQAVLERLAARRNKKRFRLTHQETKFMMSEFAKQPYPSAARREWLSLEIPGISPRQIQGTYQVKRRAKIKRHTADRDRMRIAGIFRQFDSVQGLHAQYGAVGGSTESMTPSSLVQIAKSYKIEAARP
ncbi:hypothetical protein MAA_01275 [Metarhizium robertsii ARSEF 23]|nr:uncharacterized protein MAA_01275 [Metarhizium robertsii ARSEF 23]EFZ04201.1 hypothetical protein MAA_01275 [Metarhizium robertsii ARSEF 23]